MAAEGLRTRELSTEPDDEREAGREINPSEWSRLTSLVCLPCGGLHDDNRKPPSETQPPSHPSYHCVGTEDPVELMSLGFSVPKVR